MVSRRFKDTGGDFVEVELICFDFEVRGFFVVRGAFFEQGANEAFWVFLVEEGAIVVTGGAFVDLFRGCGEPDDVSDLAEDLAVFWPTDDSTAGGNDVPGVICEATKGVAFDVSEGFLS